MSLAKFRAISRARLRVVWKCQKYIEEMLVESQIACISSRLPTTLL
jgi:hypothetical protein